MPKSRSSSLSGRPDQEEYGEQEMGERLRERLEGLEVGVQLPSRSRGGIENLRVVFGGSGANVFSESGNTYYVDTVEETCTCPDHIHRQSRCRHIEAVDIARGLVQQGLGTGSDTPIEIEPNQVVSEAILLQNEAEVQLQRQPREDDGFFYADHRQQYQEDSERLMRDPLPYYYDNVLNGSDITFGIELEFVNGVSDDIAQELHSMGICGNSSMSGYHGSRIPGKWTLERDGSVTSGHRGGELISPILTDTPETWQNIKTICEVAKRHGARVDFRTGAHVHVGADQVIDGKRQRWRRFFKMTAGFEAVFHRLAGGEQGVFRGVDDDHYTQSARSQSHTGLRTALPAETDIERYRSIIGDNIGEGKYRSINLKPFKDKKTVEFRAFNGTLTPEVIQANVKYAAGLVNAAERARTRESENFTVTDHDKRRGRIINGYRGMEHEFSDDAIINVLDTVCSRKEDKEQILAVILRNRWAR